MSDDRTDAEETSSQRQSRALWPWLLFLLLSTPLFAMAYWWMQPYRDLRMRVVDKTVPHRNYREHRVLFWMLNHEKVPAPGEAGPWKLDEDYLGFHPVQSETPEGATRDRIAPKHLRGLDALFVADNYGVYVGDYEKSERLKTHLDYSRRIYGGFDSEEVEHIEQFAREGGHLVAEFNTFASPTGERARERLEALMGLEWSGWTGRYFQDLGNFSIVPAWAKRNWERHHEETWEFEGPGWIVTHESTRIFVLETGRHVDSPGLTIASQQASDPLMKGVEVPVEFQYWFDVVEPDDSSEVLARYHLHATEQGRRKLERYGLPTRFPAAITAGRDPLRLYMAGDMSDARFELGPYYMAGWSRLQKLGVYTGKSQAWQIFIWRFYAPLVRNALDHIESAESR